MGVEYDSEQLIAELRDGKEMAFVCLFRLYYNPLLNYARNIIRDAEAANDLVQEMFCQLYENRENLNVSISLKSYLYKMVYNACLDLLKHKKIVDRYVARELIDPYFSKVMQVPEVEILLQDESIRKVMCEVVERLPDRCKEIFLLSKREGLSNKQVAEKLNISIKTVEKQMTIAFSRLRNEKR